jgi:hypothetical protein
MSYCLACTEDDAEVKKAVNEVQGIYDAHGKWEWVKWVVICHRHPIHI